MPADVVNQIGNTFNSMGFAIIKTLIIYFVLPFFAIILISRFVLKIKGRLLKAIWYLAAFASLYFFVVKGLPNMQDIYSSMVNK